MGNVKSSITVLALALSASSSAYADTLTPNGWELDLATTSPQDAKNGAIFYSTQQQPTGTGYIDPFVRIQRMGTEEGYNTDGAIQWDTKDHTGQNWTHSIRLGDVPIVTIGGVNYREFLLDINEAASGTKRMLSLNEFQIYLSDSNTLTGLDRTNYTFTNGALYNTNLYYDLDSVGTDTHGDKVVRMDYTQASGSGSGDMFVYVADSKFTGQSSNRFLYLYSAFGRPDASDSGFEEWATIQGRAPAVVPLPAAAWMGVVLLGGIGTLKKWRDQSTGE